MNATETGTETDRTVIVTEPDATKPVKMSRTKKIIAIRITMRLCMIGLLIGLSKIVCWKCVATSYMDWIESFEYYQAALIFFCFMIPFVSFMPGSYAPTCLAGATFGVGLGCIISYIAMNVGALINLGVVRMCLKPCAYRTFGKRLTTYEGLDRLLLTQPFQTVVLLRIPYLGSGLLNYAFSLSDVQIASYYLGNAVGFIPGSVLFALLGNQFRGLLAELTNGDPAVGSIILLGFLLVAIIGSVIGITVLVRKEARKRLAEVALAKKAEKTEGNEGRGENEGGQVCISITEGSTQLAGSTTTSPPASFFAAAGTGVVDVKIAVLPNPGLREKRTLEGEKEGGKKEVGLEETDVILFTISPSPAGSTTKTITAATTFAGSVVSATTGGEAVEEEGYRSSIEFVEAALM